MSAWDAKLSIKSLEISCYFSTGDPILKEKSTLCLTATSVVFLNHCFELVNSGEE